VDAPLECTPFALDALFARTRCGTARPIGTHGPHAATSHRLPLACWGG